MRHGRSSAERWQEFLDSLGLFEGLAAGPEGAVGRTEGRGGPAGEAKAVFRELDLRYREPQRHYHSWAHIEACLAELEGVRALSPHPGALELAIWFHDAVYDPGAQDNEERSASLAREAGGRLGLPGPLTGEAEALILATRHIGAGPTVSGVCREDTGLMVDIDLAIFGKPWRVFAAYEEGIRREYQGTPEEQRRKRRKGILQGFLDRPRIYVTDVFRTLYEQEARANLKRSIARLG